MKKTRSGLAVLALSLLATTVLSQNVAINEDGSLPNPNAILDVKSFTKGVLIPRVSTNGRLSIPNTRGLLVYDTTTSSIWYNTGAAWQSLAPDGNSWLLNGNNISSNDTSKFIGTTTWRPLIFKVNNELAGFIDNSSRNTLLGSAAGIATNMSSGIQNTAIGYWSMHANIDGYSNTAAGFLALRTNTSGRHNTAIGTQSMDWNTLGNYNTATGELSLYQNTTGTYNTAVGLDALIYNGTGSYNTAIGAFATVASQNLTNATAIGYNASVNASNKVRIGNSSVTVIEGQVPFTTPSDGRYKYQVKEDVKGLDFIMQLRPITYQFDVKRFDALQRQPQNDKNAAPASNIIQASYDEASAIRRSGFIAQEVEKAADASGYNFSGIIKPKTEREHYSLSYESFVVPLVKGMQEQQQLINRHEQTIRRQEQKLAEQDAKAAQQEKKLAELQQQLSELTQLVQSIKSAR